MARGTESKNIITKKILDTFEGSFQYDKEIRIPIMENGEQIQIKITLTAAKVNVEPGSENALPSAAAPTDNRIDFDTIEEKPVVEPTKAERENVKNLLAFFGL